MGASSSGYGSHHSDSACVTTAPACSLCTGDTQAQQMCKEEEEVLVEPYSVLEELGFFSSSGTSGKRAHRSPGRTGGLCQIVPLLLPPSPARARCCPHRGDSPNVLAPQYGSPQLIDAPPVRITESPPKPTYMTFDFDYPSPVPMPILPPPTPDDHVDIQTPVSAAPIKCSAPVPTFLEGRRSVDIDQTATLIATPEDEGHGFVPPSTPLAFVDMSSSLGMAAAETMAPSQPSPRPKRPWSSCATQSPYRGGVLSLFTPSPPSPPRRRPIVSPTLPDGKDLKDLGEEDQIAFAIAVSLQEAGHEPEVDVQPAQPAPSPPERESSQTDSRAISSSPDTSPRASPKPTSRRSLLRWKLRRGSKQSI